MPLARDHQDSDGHHLVGAMPNNEATEARFGDCLTCYVHYGVCCDTVMLYDTGKVGRINLGSHQVNIASSPVNHGDG